MLLGGLVGWLGTQIKGNTSSDRFQNKFELKQHRYVFSVSRPMTQVVLRNQYPTHLT